VRRVLGHRAIATTTSIYTGAETRAAGSHFAAVIAERRRAVEPRNQLGKLKAPLLTTAPSKRKGRLPWVASVKVV
jgi:hypothetical protein